jgi:hypothetical protein
LCQVGEVYNRRYLIVKKLGWGHFSTVWLARDLDFEANEEAHAAKGGKRQSSREYVAIKVQKSSESYRDAAFDEIEMLASVRKQVGGMAGCGGRGGTRCDVTDRIVCRQDDRCLMRHV